MRHSPSIRIYLKRLPNKLKQYLLWNLYIYDMLQYRSWVKRQIDYCHARNPKVPVHITIGTGSSHGRLESLDELVFQIDEANRLGGDGAHFFHWMSFRDFCDGLAKTRYAAPANK